MVKSCVAKWCHQNKRHSDPSIQFLTFPTMDWFFVNWICMDSNKQLSSMQTCEMLQPKNEEEFKAQGQKDPIFLSWIEWIPLLLIQNKYLRCSLTINELLQREIGHFHLLYFNLNYNSLIVILQNYHKPSLINMTKVTYVRKLLIFDKWGALPFNKVIQKYIHFMHSR